MLRELQDLFRQSVAAFRAELGRQEPEDQVAELLSAMRREMVSARASIAELNGELKRVQAELSRENVLLQQCERRGALAERIHDAETMRVAAAFAERHRERVAVLEQRVRAVEAEHALRSREADEMLRKYQEADANRFALVAQLRRTQARQRMQSRLDGSTGPFVDFVRMEEAVEDGSSYADALGSVMDADPDPPRAPTTDIEEKLQELKRRVGQE